MVISFGCRRGPKGPRSSFFGWVEGKPPHAVPALDETNEWAYVITVYEPDLEHFEADYKTRRKGT